MMFMFKHFIFLHRTVDITSHLQQDKTPRRVAKTLGTV